MQLHDIIRSCQKDLNENYIRKKSQLESLVKAALMSETEYRDLEEEYEEIIEVGMGGSALKTPRIDRACRCGPRAASGLHRSHRRGPRGLSGLYRARRGCGACNLRRYTVFHEKKPAPCLSGRRRE